MGYIDVEPLPLHCLQDMCVLNQDLNETPKDELFVRKVTRKLHTYFYIRTGKRPAHVRAWMHEPGTYDISGFDYDPYESNYHIEPKMIWLIGPCFDIDIEEI